MTGVRCLAAGISAQGRWLNKAAAQMKGWEVRVQERGCDGKIMWHVRVDAGTGKATRPQVEAQQRILISKLQVNTAVGSHRGCKGTVTCTNVQSHESQASALTGHGKRAGQRLRHPLLRNRCSSQRWFGARRRRIRQGSRL